LSHCPDLRGNVAVKFVQGSRPGLSVWQLCSLADAVTERAAFAQPPGQRPRLVVRDLPAGAL
jgi:hypothetical protein